MIDFLLVAVALFAVIKIINTAKARFDAQKADDPPAPPEDILLLREIRDSLAK